MIEPLLFAKLAISLEAKSLEMILKLHNDAGISVYIMLLSLYMWAA
jgi:hypothetical protein